MNETNHTLPFSIKLRHVFWIIFICIWFSACSHNKYVPVLPEGYKIICNQFEKYSWIDYEGHKSVSEFDTRQDAIEWADFWESTKPIADKWSECEGE